MPAHWALEGMKVGIAGELKRSSDHFGGLSSFHGSLTFAMVSISMLASLPSFK
jgi:hypothetical protein